MSYTVVVVEDEKIVRDELIQSIHWDRLGFTVAGVAGDGLEGEALIKKLDPDVVITDIRLPGITGLEMLEHCSVDHAVIMSGYTDFSFMKQAIRLGVFDYLLKPIDDEEMEKTLEKLAGKMKEEYTDYAILTQSRNVTGSELIALPHTVNNHVVDNAITFVATNYSKPVGLQEAAQYLGISE